MMIEFNEKLTDTKVRLISHSPDKSTCILDIEGEKVFFVRKNYEAKEIVEDELFEKFWTTEIISAITGNIDYPMWGKIDKDITQAIFNYGRRYERKYGIKSQPKKILDEIGEAEIKQMLDDIEYYQKRVEELEKIHKEPQSVKYTNGSIHNEYYKEPQYLYVYLDDNYELSTIPLDNDDWTYIGRIKLEVDDGN